MKNLKQKLHKWLFPKEHKALMAAFSISAAYMYESPSYEKRGVGEDIYTKLSQIMK